MKSRAQSTVEYVLLLTTIVAALIAMQVYAKRAVQGRMRANASDLSEGNLYSPGATFGFSLTTTNVEEYLESKGRTTTSQATVIRDSGKREEVLPFALEPRRY